MALHEILALKNSAQLAQKANTTQEAWITPTLLNGWVDFDIANYASCQYMKDTLGFVHLKGMVKSGTNATNLFTLPPGYRPAKIEYFPMPLSGGGTGQMAINNNGGVLLAISNATWTNLNGITFKAV